MLLSDVGLGAQTWWDYEHAYGRPPSEAVLASLDLSMQCIKLT